MWLRGILAEAHGVQPKQIRWVTFEDAHVPEYRDPLWAERAAPGQELLAMLRDGELDAVIVGNEVPDDPTLRTVFPDPATAAAAFWRRHQLVPVNHMVTVCRELAAARPELVCELLRMFRDASARSGADPLPMGRSALRPAVELALRYAAEQGLLPRPLREDEVWEGLPRAAFEPTANI
jgi:4,5-dihydroxyphthalate decarboxylase